MNNQGGCSKCKFQNRAGNRFCSNCGTVLNVVSLSGPKLVILDDDRKRYIMLQPEDNTIGREISNHVVIDDNKISKTHAVLHVSNENCWIKDVGSSNGIYVNGQKIALQKSVMHGSLLKLGSTIMRFELH